MKSKKSMSLKSVENDCSYFDYDQKIQVACICHGCGKQHLMQFHWAGTGTPRKYCENCKNRFE